MSTQKPSTTQIRVAGFVSTKEIVNDIQYLLSLLDMDENIRIAEGGFSQATAFCMKNPSPELLLIDISGEQNPIEQLNALAHHVEPGTKVLGIGAQNSVELYRSLIALGLIDYLPLPLNTMAMEEALKRALVSTYQKRRTAGKKVCVIGAKGGCGVSTVTANLSARLSGTLGCRTVVADADRQFGDIDMLLGAEAGTTLDLLVSDTQRAQNLMVEHATQSVSENLSLLKSANGFVEETPPLEPEALEALNERLCEHYNLVVWDTPLHSLADETIKRMATNVDIAVIVFTPTVSSARGLRELLTLFEESPARTLLVANRIHPAKVESIPLKEIAEIAGHSIDIVVPHAPKAAIIAADTGELSKNTKFSAAFEEMACKLIGKRPATRLLDKLPSWR